MRSAALLISCCVLLSPVLGKRFVFRNRHGSTVWVGTLGNAGKPAPNGGGFRLGANSEATLHTADNWAGRFWVRTGCNFNGGSGHCETGDCGNRLACNGAGGVPPVSLAEFTLNGAGGQDFYDVSLVDGFNVPLLIAPISRGRNPNNRYRCGVAGCMSRLNDNCPNELRQRNWSGATVACKTACTAYNTDQYCCRGNYGQPSTCNPNTWPQNSAAYFKNNCPNAYSYAYDDHTSTYTCADSGYIITIG